MTKGTGIIGDIVYVECLALGIPVYRGHSVPEGDVEPGGRAVVHVGRTVRDSVWIECWVNVNLLVPDMAEGEADLRRLEELEENAIGVFRKTHGLHDGIPYVLDLDGTETMAAPELKAHLVNCRLLFKSLNID